MIVACSAESLSPNRFRVARRRVSSSFRGSISGRLSEHPLTRPHDREPGRRKEKLPQMRENLPWKWEKLPLQITALLSGKRVAAPKREIDEVEGAHRAYAKVATFNAYSVQDLLKAHGLMTQGLVKRPGEFRKCAVGVVNAAGDVVHLAPRSELVPGLMDELLAWLSDSDEPMLVKSCVFHWCFENIHPFPDGNGRMGRLWQMVLLGSWNPLFYAAPLENIVWAHQAEDYAAIRAVEENGGNIRPFIEFMLDKILRPPSAIDACRRLAMPSYFSSLISLPFL